MSPETCAYEWIKWNTDMYVHYLLDSQQEGKRRYRCRCAQQARAGNANPTTCTSCNQCIITILISVKKRKILERQKKKVKTVASVVVVNN